MKQKSKAALDLTAKELVLMSNLYLNKEYPYNFLTLEEVAKVLNCSKATAMKLTSALETKGCVRKERGFISFYYPIRDNEIRHSVLKKLGF